VTKIVVMLIWMGGGHGGPATIQGFASLASCEAARPAVVRQLTSDNILGPPRPWAVCMELTP
jgi:hypothetical protein